MYGLAQSHAWWALNLSPPINQTKPCSNTSNAILEDWYGCFFKNVQKFGETKLNIKKTAKALGKVQYLEKLEFML